MRKLYYVIEIELDDALISGIKFVIVYEIINNIPVRIFDLEIAYEDSSEDAIQNYLNDNGYGDKIFELIQL